MNNDIVKKIRLELQGKEKINQDIKNLHTNLAQLEKILDKLNGKDTNPLTKRQKEIVNAIKDQVKAEEELNKILKERKSIWSQLETGQETAYQKFQKYRGINGYFKSLTDRKGAQIAGLQTAAKGIEEKLRDPNISVEDKKKLLSERDILAKQIGSGKTQINKINTAAAITSSALNVIKKAGDTLGISFHSLATQALDVVKSFIDLRTGIATYDTRSSLITNATAREQQLKYGLSSAQNWAFTQAKSMLNIQSDEDLMYMNVEQRNRFLQYMQRYSQWYDKLEHSGVLADIQEMQLQFQELKQELGMEFLSWVAANKDTIMVALKGIFAALLTVADAVLKIASFFSGGNTTNNTFNINSTVTNNGNQTMTDMNVQNQWSSLAKQITTSMG